MTVLTPTPTIDAPECPVADIEPWRPFTMRVAAIHDICPTFRRVTLTGEDVSQLGDPGFDQRVRIVFPPESAAPHGCVANNWAWATPLLEADNWYEALQSMPEEHRPSARPYTTRNVRWESNELDIDMGMHEADGPAARWVRHVRVGDEVLVIGRNRYFVGDCFGQDFLLPEHTDAILIGADVTAAPAVARILESLPHSATGIAVVELPCAEDAAYLPTHPGIELRTFARNGAPNGEILVREVQRAAAEIAPAGTPHEVEEIDVDTETLWEAPRHSRGGAALKHTTLYAWLAGEAGAVKTLRRHLVSERGIDRRSVAFMGYWRLGKSKG